jgi:hypothetical protein
MTEEEAHSLRAGDVIMIKNGDGWERRVFSHLDLTPGVYFEEERNTVIYAYGGLAAKNALWGSLSGYKIPLSTRLMIEARKDDKKRGL